MYRGLLTPQRAKGRSSADNNTKHHAHRYFWNFYFYPRVSLESLSFAFLFYFSYYVAWLYVHWWEIFEEKFTDFSEIKKNITISIGICDRLTLSACYSHHSHNFLYHSCILLFICAIFFSLSTIFCTIFSQIIQFMASMAQSRNFWLVQFKCPPN